MKVLRTNSQAKNAVVLLTIVCHLMQPLVVLAGGAIIVDKAGDEVEPMVITAPNGVPLVNIATPSAQGVSRNTFTQFDVGQNGVILNNSQKLVQTHLGGLVASNPLLGRDSARIILNEVTGATASQLHGFMEVAGQQAEFILANENGITCNGCGFINIPNATLSTGQVSQNTKGILGFDVKQGMINIQGKGLNGTSVAKLFIQGKQVVIDAPINAQALAIIAGSNYVNADGDVISSTDSTSKNLAIDSRALGGMYANSIYIRSTDKGLGVNLAGTVLAQEGTLVIDSDGQLRIQANIGASQGVSLRGSTGLTLDSVSEVQSLTDLSLKTDATLNIAGQVTANGAVSLQGQNVTTKAQANLASGADLSINAQQKALLAGTAGSHANIDIQAHHIDLQGHWSAVSNASLEADQQLQLRDGVSLTSGDNLTLVASALQLKTAYLEANQTLTLQASDRLTSHSSSVLAANVQLQGTRSSRQAASANITIENSQIGA